jgi:hypothetical protein
MHVGTCKADNILNVDCRMHDQVPCQTARWCRIALPAVHTRNAKIYIDDPGLWILGGSIPGCMLDPTKYGGEIPAVTDTISPAR